MFLYSTQPTPSPPLHLTPINPHPLLRVGKAHCFGEGLRPFILYLHLVVVIYFNRFFSAASTWWYNCKGK